MAITRQNTGRALLGRDPHPEGGTMVRIKITSGTIVGGAHASVGEIRTVEEREAKTLFANNKAVPYAGAPPRPTTREAVPDPSECASCAKPFTSRMKKVPVEGGGTICAECARK